MIKIDCPKLVKISIIPAIIFLVLFPGKAFASTDSTINFEGKIVRNDTGYEGLNVTTGTPACVVAGNGNDTCDFQVKYYSAASGGTLMLTEIFTNVEIGQYNGAFTLALGSTSSPTPGTYAACKGGTCDNLQEVVNATSDIYVELGFSPNGNSTFSETFSRMPIQASAYALKAKYAAAASTAFQFDTSANSSGYTSPSAGMVYYDTTDSALKVYNGSAWSSIGSGTGSGSLFTDGGIFTYLTSLTDHFVLGSSSYTAIGSESYATYLTGLTTDAPFSFDMTAQRLTISGAQAQSGLTVYSNYNSTGAWPVATIKADGSSFDSTVLQVTQDGTGNILTLQKGSTDAFVFENPLTFYIHPRTDNPTTYTDRLYNVNGTLYWNGSALGTGSSLWTDAGTYSYLTSTTDDVIIGGDSTANAKFFFDVSTGNLGIGTSTPGAKLDIAGSSSTITNTTGDITISPDKAVVIKANDTSADILTKWENSVGTVLGLINQNGYASFGSSTSNTGAILTLGSSSSTVAQIHLTSGYDVSVPTSGDMWWDGTSLYFYDGSTSVDLLTAGGGGSNVLSSSGSAATNGYINLEHDTNSYDVVASGWICVGGSSNAACSGGQWKNIKDTDLTVTQSLSNQWNNANVNGIIRSIIRQTDVELGQSVNVGTGSDGIGSVASGTTALDTASISGRACADAINYSVTGLTSTTATLLTTPTAGCLNPNDEILLINLKGTSSSVVNLGNYETLKVQSVSGTTVNFVQAKLQYYGDNATDDTNIGTATGNQRVMLQRVPNYSSVSVASGATLTMTAWNGTKGGVLFFRSSGTVSVSGSISMASSGYVGGATPGNNVPGNQGESYRGGIGSGTTSANYGGGGGGTYGTSGTSYGGTGGGGGYGAAGSTGANGQNSRAGGTGGGTYGSASLTSLLLGSGGGSGGTVGSSPTTGGSGGGIIAINANTISVSGSVNSNGGTGLGNTGDNTSGGGGSGGSVKLAANILNLGTNLVTASGGVATAETYTGGAGGVGRVAIVYQTSYSGSTSSPAAAYSTLGYYDYGTYISPVISTPNAQSYSNLRWESTLNTYGKISVQTRSGASSDPTDGTWEAWKPYTSGTNYTTLQSMDTYSQWTGTNATVAAGDITRPVTYGYEDDIENTGTNITKVTSSTNGGYMESTITAADLTNYDYVTFWVRASQAGNTIRIGMGESAATEQYEDITIDTANVWQKVYWDLSDIATTSRDAITKLRITNFSTSSNVIYVDNIKGEKLLSTSTGSSIASTPNNYFQYRVLFTTTNLSYQPQLNNIAFSYGTGYRIVMYDANNVRLYNYTNSTQYLRLEVVANSGSGSSGGSGFVNGLAVSHVQDGAGAIAFQFNTSSTFSNTTSKLLSVMNNSSEKMYLDSNGNLYVSGTITSGAGTSTALLNNSGTTVANKSLVTLDTTTNNAFTTTTVAGMQGAFGVVQGVDVNHDTNGDGICNSGDTCLVTFEGTANVNLDNAATAAKGDYIYSSTTAGKGHSSDSTQQANGLIGVVSSIANASSGYVQIIFDAQNRVTADLYLNVGFDSNAYQDMYNQLSSDYTKMSLAERNGVVQSGQSQSIMFDNFVDSLKIDSANSTVGLDADSQKAGLWGGLTIDGTTLDVAGNRYLGSSTATLLVSKYYDRTQSGAEGQDSTPETMVDLGIDPNWYNGVALQTTTNLSTSYNGSLITASGVYATGSEHGYIDLTITGTTVTGITANIVSSDGNCSVTNASLAFGSVYAFTSGSCSGSTITINPARNTYNNGDKFRILSWYVEPTSANDRGSGRAFPLRSVILASSDASNGYLSIIDADTQRVWMKFVQTSAGEMLGVALNNTISSISMSNGSMNVGMNGSAATGMYSVQFNDSQVYKYNTSGKSISNKNISDRNIANTYSVVNASQALVNNIVNDVSSATVPNKPTQTMTVSGWGYVNGSANPLSETVSLPYKFIDVPVITTSIVGFSASVAPTSLQSCSSNPWGGKATASAPTQTSFVVSVVETTAAPASSTYYCYTWTATGQVSPKQLIAVAAMPQNTGSTGGYSIINRTDQTATNFTNNNATDQNYNTLVIAGNTLYGGYIYNGTTPVLQVIYNFLTKATNTIGNVRDGWYTNVATSSWTNIALIGTGNISSLRVTLGTSTIDSKSNTLYVGTSGGLSVIQEKQSGNATLSDGKDENNGSVKYYTKDYISEQMVGDIRGMWSFSNNTTNTTVTDVSIKGNTTTAARNTSLISTSGVRGTGYNFNGTSDYIASSSTLLDSPTSGSVGMWVKPSANGATNGGSVWQNTTLLAKGGIYLGVQQLANNKVRIYYFDTGSVARTIDSNTTLPLNAWTYVVYSWNSSGSTIYINGVADITSSLTWSNVSSSNTGAYFVLGQYGSSYYYAGAMDEPFVTASTISVDQVKAMYQDGLRALQGSHSLNDTYNQLSGTTNDVRSILVTPDNKTMYVGTEGGGISQIDLTSSTRLNAYTTVTDPSTSTNNIEALSGRYYPAFAGDAGASGSFMGIDSNGNNSTGTYYSKTMSFDTNTNKAYLWMNANIDSADTSSSILVYASNDNGTTYVQGGIIKTNTTGTLPEYEYSFDFPISGKDYKVKFVITRGSSNKATAYITNWGLAQMQIDTADANGLFTNENDTVANGSYLDVVHGQNTYDLVANGWVFDTTLSKWVEINNTDNSITQNLSNQWSSANTSGIIRSVIKATDVELAPGINVGTGADGDITVSNNTNINTQSLITNRSCSDGGDAVNYNISSFNSLGTQATLSTTPSTGCLNVGDEVLLINLQGTAAAYGNVGNYETLKVLSVSGTTVTFQAAKSKYYGNNLGDDSNIGVATSNQRVMLQRVPNYFNVTVNVSMTFSPTAWNGVKGGVMFFRARGTVNIAGAISVSGMGYAGGTGGTIDVIGMEGDTFAYNVTRAMTPLLTGGGGGEDGGNHGYYEAGGGAGGSLSTAGTNGGTYSAGGYGGTGATTVYTLTAGKLYFGGAGGGGGGGNPNGGYGGNGGNGGGIVGISANTVNISGYIYNYGTAGGAYYNGSYGGGGGGGAGGSTIVWGSSLALGTTKIINTGGTGGDGASTADGGTGGSGLVSVYYSNSVSGTTTPTYTGTSMGFNSYGTYISPVISTPNAQSYSNLKWESTLNTYGKISVQTRSGNSSDPTDGTWEAWKPYTSGTNYTTLQSMDTYTQWSGTNATVAAGDITRPSSYGYEDDIENIGTNITKVTSSTNGGYMESTITAADLTNYDYVTFWVRASQAGNTIRIGMGESAGTEQYEDITIDTANTWQKVYWDLSDIPTASRDAITKLRITNFSSSSNVIYVDNIRGEKLLSTSTGSSIASTPNNYFQYRVLFTTTNLSYQPQLNNISMIYSSGFKIQVIDANTVRLYNNSGKTQKMKLDVIVGSAAVDLRSSQYALNIAPTTAQIDGGTNTNSIWVNKLGTGGNLLKLQTNSNDMMVVDSSGNMTLAGVVAVTGGSLTLGVTGDQGTIRYNSTTNRIEFSNDGVNWLALGDSLRKFVLSAEYPGAVLSGDGTNNTGTMTSDNTGSSSNSMNYYNWTSSAVSLNDYDVRVRFTLPSDFSGWGTTGGVTLNYVTQSTSATNNAVDMYIYKDSSSTIDGTSTGNVSTVVGTWQTVNISATNFQYCKNAGDTCVVILRMYSMNSNYVRVGDIAITYNRSL